VFYLYDLGPHQISFFFEQLRVQSTRILYIPYCQQAHYKETPKNIENTTTSYKSAKTTLGQDAKRDKVLEQLLPPTPGDSVIYQSSHHTAVGDAPLGAGRLESAGPTL
jgi:hypothetical protein